MAKPTRPFHYHCSVTLRRGVIYARSAIEALQLVRQNHTQIIAPEVSPIFKTEQQWHDYLRSLKQAENVAFHQQKEMLRWLAAHQRGFSPQQELAEKQASVRAMMEFGAMGWMEQQS